MQVVFLHGCVSTYLVIYIFVSLKKSVTENIAYPKQQNNNNNEEI